MAACGHRCTDTIITILQGGWQDRNPHIVWHGANAMRKGMLTRMQRSGAFLFVLDSSGRIRTCVTGSKAQGD